MEVSIKKLTLVTGLFLGMLALPVAYGEGESDGMTVMMNGNIVTADPENIKWVPNKSVPHGMQIVLLYGNPSQPGPYIFRAKMPSGYRRRVRISSGISASGRKSVGKMRCSVRAIGSFSSIR